MNSKSQFAALEMMSRAKAAAARKEMEYWLAEADEWKRLQECTAPSLGGAIPTQLDCCSDADKPLT
jgi:hypothetical protein